LAKTPFWNSEQELFKSRALSCKFLQDTQENGQLLLKGLQQNISQLNEKNIGFD
jgi:hypothetical protein